MERGSCRLNAIDTASIKTRKMTSLAASRATDTAPPVDHPRDNGSESWWAAIEPLWVPGLALLCLATGYFLFQSPWLALQAKAYDYAQYVVAAVIFPMILFGVPIIWRWQHWSLEVGVRVRRGLAVGCLLSLIGFLVVSMLRYGPGRMAMPLVLAFMQTALATWFNRRESQPAYYFLLIYSVSLVAWTVGLSLYLEALVQPPIFLTGFVVAFVLACSATWNGPARSRVTHRWSSLLPNTAALILIGFMSLRTEHLFEVLAERGALHHWGAWVGPAELVRQGGWLLWDVPSMYGFLSILPLAAIPSATPWQALYLLGALSFFIVSGSLFLAVRQLRPGPINYCFALAVAISAPLFSPTYDSSAPVMATFIFPNGGAYRYIWCFLLVVTLVWEFLTPERSRRHRNVLIIGCVVWVIGVLWSPESAVFCTGAWLPAYAVACFRTTADRRKRWLRLFRQLLYPAILLTMGIGTIVSVYLVGLGRLPDAAAYFDYVFGLGTAVLVEINDPTGPVLGLLLGLTALATAAAYLGMRSGLPSRTMALWLGLLGAFLATGFYGYVRDYVMLHPVGYAVLAILLVLVARLPHQRMWSPLVRSSLVPLFVVLLVSPIAAIAANPRAAGEAAIALGTTLKNGLAIEPLIPDADPELQTLMAQAELGPDASISFLGSWIGNLMQPWTSQVNSGERVVITQDWLPGHPYVSLRYVPEGRGAIYVQRYIERERRSGWLVQHKTGEHASMEDLPEFVSGREAWLAEELLRSHVPTKIFESANWQLVWFEFVDGRSDIVRPELVWDYVPRLPSDVSINGRPLADMRDPELWTVFGNGWSLLKPNSAGRRMNSGSQLFIYSPTQRTIELHLVPARVRGNRAFYLVANGDSSRGQPLITGKPTALSLQLQPGWNPITLTIETTGPSSSRLSEDERAARRQERRAVRRAAVTVEVPPRPGGSVAPAQAVPATPSATAPANASDGPVNDGIRVLEIDLVLTPN